MKIKVKVERFLVSTRGALFFVALGVIGSFLIWRNLYTAFGLAILNVAILSSVLCSILGMERLKRVRSESRAAQQIIDSLTREHWLFLAEMNQELNATLDYEALKQKVVDLAIPVFADYCALALQDEEKQIVLSNEAVIPELFPMLRTVTAERDSLPRFDESKSLLGRLIQDRRPKLLLEDVPALFLELGFPKSKLRMRSAIFLPLAIRGQMLGFLICGMTKPSRTFGENDLALAKQMALHASRALENAKLLLESEENARWRAELIAVVAHDIRNPLTAVELQAGMCKLQLDRNGNPDELGNSIGSIQKATRQALRIINGLLNLTRVEARAKLMERKPESVSRIIIEIIDILRPIADEKGTRLYSQTPTDELTAVINRDYIAQVLLNLVGNAIKFTGPGGAVHISAVQVEHGCELHVIDNGCGISQDDLGKIFGRFWQGSNEARNGIGIGLAISKSIIEAHGGRITVKSKLGEGSTFSVFLPEAR